MCLHVFVATFFACRAIQTNMKWRQHGDEASAVNVALEGLCQVGLVAQRLVSRCLCCPKQSLSFPGKTLSAVN